MLNFRLFTKRAKTTQPTLQLGDPSAYYGLYRGDKNIKPVKDMMEKTALRRTTEEEMREAEAFRISIS